MRLLATALILSWAAVSAAQDKSSSMSDPAKLTAPAPPQPDLKVPVSSSPGERNLTEADVEAIVARVIARTTPRQDMTPASYPQPPATASSQYQGPVQMPMPSRVDSPTCQSYAQAAPQQVAVYVPAGPIAQATARLGHKLARLGEPRVKTFRAAPVAAYVPASQQAPIYASGQR